MMACEKSQEVELTDIYSTDKGSKIIAEFNYDVTDIPGIIKLADPQLYEEIYAYNVRAARNIEVGYDGIWWEDHQHATCILPPNLCYIIIYADQLKSENTLNEHLARSNTGNHDLIKVLPDAPKAIKVTHFETQIINGITHVIYKE